MPEKAQIRDGLALIGVDSWRMQIKMAALKNL